MRSGLKVSAALRTGLGVLMGLAVGCADRGEGADVGQQDAVDDIHRVLGTTSGGVDTPTIQCDAPANYTTLTLATGQNTAPVTVEWSTNAAEDIAAGTYAVALFDNGVEKATGGAVAPFQLQLGYGEHVVSLAVTEDGSAMGHDGAHCNVVVRVTRACLADADCADSYYCNTNTCESAGGGTKTCAFGPPPIANCCESNFDCASGSVCDTESHTCGACAIDADCDDGNACTEDLCEGGSCVSVTTDPECCDCSVLDTIPASEQCTGGGFCGTPNCNCDSNQCEYELKELPSGPCCETGDHAACNDGDPCTEDTCVANACRHTPALEGVTDCCSTDAQCNDGNPCTVEACDVATNTCQTTATSGDGCCASDSECDDGDPLTWDACVTSQCVFTEDYGYCELTGLSDIVINELMVNPAEVTDANGEWIELHNRTDDPIDISGWSLTELGQDPQAVVIATDEPLIVPAFGSVVLCRNADAAANGGITCDYGYGADYTLSNAEDEVVLLDASGAVADEVHYDGGTNFPNIEQSPGRSMALKSPEHDNNLGASWSLSVAPIALSSDKGTPGTANADVYGVLELTQCHETPDDDVCTIDTCIDNACVHLSKEGCCNVDSDCGPPTACHAATCVDHQCQFAPIPAPECCLADGDCDDGSPCSLDKCVANQCFYGDAPDAAASGCCEADADCPGAGNPCLVSTCDLDSNTCEPATLAVGVGCCATNSYPDAADPSECDDGDPSTIDACKDYRCFSFPDASWCDAQPDSGGINNCHLDGNPCTDNACNVDTNTCLFNPVPGCCAADSDCFDGNPCTRDSCNHETGSCEFPKIFNCCFQSTADADCDDGNVCTNDVCTGLASLDGSPGEFWGRCRRLRISSSCCNSNADCNDGNACTTDQCDPVTNTCSHDPVVPEDGSTCCDANVGPISAQCGDGNRCTTDSCVANRCAHAPVQGLGGATCCDLDAAGVLGSEAEQCDDGNACTDDVCAFGLCRHLPTTGMDCCATDADCNDANSCTVDACITVSGTKLCSNTALNCDDGEFCNGAETCNPGTGCTTLPGSVPVLDDGVDCTIDICDEGDDVVTHTPNNGLCDNGLFCDGFETCSATIGCQDGTPPSGDDGIPCTTDGCNEDTNSFFHTPNDGVCDDGKLCNGEETCDVIQGCVPGTGSVDVDDGIACTIDSCDDATQQPKHLPDNSLCNDGLVCTSDVCDPATGCVNTLLPNVCLIGGVCYSQGATAPGNDCQICDPATSTSSFSPKPAGVESCNGIDDDCDGLTDETTSGTPITQACQNSCGEVGTETCTNGIFTGCTAPVLTEICDDGADNDCDGVTDGDLCGDQKPPVIGAELVFSSSIGRPENLVVDNGDGTYSTRVRDLANPNKSGVVGVSAYGAAGPTETVDVLAAPVVDVEVVSLRETLYADAAEARFAIQVRDLRSRPVATGTAVTLAVSGLGLTEAEGAGSCTTDAVGRCVISWTAPASIFEVGGQVQAQIVAGGLPAAPQILNVVQDSGPLVFAQNGGGLVLPKAPRFPGATFQVPVYLSTTGATVAAYDIDVTFNRFMLQVTALNPGGCSAFGPPVSNLANGANTSGVLQFNAINSSTSDPCASGDLIHIATISFKVLAGLTADDPTVSAAVSGVIVDMTDPNFVTLAEDEPMLMADSEGIDFEGKVRAWSAAVMGILASSPDAQLINWKPVTGVGDTMQLTVTAYRRDFTTGDVATALNTGYGNTSPQVAGVTQSGFVAAGTLPGNTTAAVTHQGAVSKTQVHNLIVDPVALELTDTVLQPISGAVSPGGSPIYQTARWRARTALQDVSGVAWEQEVTDRFQNVGQVLPSNGLGYNNATGVISGTTVGSYTVSLRDPQGTTVATAELAVSAEPVTCTGLQVIAPCTVELAPPNPQSTPVQLGSSDLMASVYAYLSQHGETCQTQVYAQFDDGNRMRITGSTGLSYSTVDPGIVSVTGTGLLTAQGGGTTNINAQWTVNGTPLCNGTAPVTVSLPEAVGITVTPATSAIAISSADPAATVKGLPTARFLTVFVNYADGSSQEFTGDPSTVFDASSLDPLDILSMQPGGVVQASGNGFGTAAVKVSVGLFPGLTGSATVQVVSATGLSAEVYEPYSPTLPRVTDHTFSMIENTGVRQDGTFEVGLTFSDGTLVDVTDAPTLVIQPVTPGTQNPLNGVVVFDKTTRKVTGQVPGNVDVLFELGSLVTQVPNMVVESAKEGIVFLVPELPQETLTGIIDQGSAQVKVWGVMNDGTRRRFYDSRFINGLLAFGSTVPAAATINQNGTATIRGNGSTVVTVDLAAAFDNAPGFDPPAELALDCNLAPDCGDVDLGDTTGLAFKDRAPGDTFILEARVNTCGKALGAFDLNLTYDSDVLKVDSVEAWGATEDVIFTANPFFPGEILVNAIFNPLGTPQSGSTLPIFRVHYTALKGGDGISEMDGTVESMLDLASDDIGPATPRAVVAAEGLLDPTCSEASAFDLNGDCVVDAADVRVAQRAVLEGRMTLRAAQGIARAAQ